MLKKWQRRRLSKFERWLAQHVYFEPGKPIPPAPPRTRKEGRRGQENTEKR